MSLRRGGTPLMGAIPSLEASNQAQIEDLVQRNRTLEHANKKLDEQLAQERERSKQAVLTIQAQWEKNQQEWKEGCEDILASYRIVQKQVVIELEKERSTVIKEMAVTRVEKLQRLQRDFKIKLFQIQEEELDRKIEDLERENTIMAEEAERNLSKERERCTEYASRWKETRESLERALKEQKEIEAKYNKLKADRSNLEAASGTLDSKLERATLQLQGHKTKITDLERLNDELKRTNTDLTHQLERWQNLETKGGEAAEEQRKKLIDVETQLAELREAYDKEREGNENALAKEKRRTEKMKDSAANWESEAKERERATNEAQKQVAKLQKLNEKLKNELEVERARVRPPSPLKPKAPSPPPADEEIEEAEEAEEEPTTRNRKTSAKPESSRATAKPGPSTVKGTKPLAERHLLQVARKSTGGKPPPPRPKEATTTPIDVDVVEISDAEVEEEPAPTKKRDGKGKAKAAENEEEQEEAPAPQKAKGKRKAVEEDKSDGDGVEFVDKSKAAKKRSRAPSEVRDTNTAKAKPKPRSRAGSRQPVARTEPENEDEDDEVAPKKKKRRIISAAPPGPFAFGSLNLGQFDDQINALNIPSVLSPVREDQPVPQRSTSVAIGSSLGKFMTKITGQRKP